jgi:proteasome lid subunit RPN8/RPN11
MLQALVEAASRLLNDWHRALTRERIPVPSEAHRLPPPVYRPLRRIIITDGVGHTLFEEFAAHQSGARGDEETGWILLGVRDEDEATVLATLPAGTARNAGVSHVQFDSEAQALGSRIVRQADRRVTILGVVHTHPGSLRHPSDGDFRGDRIWVKHLRGREGVFAIGTADSLPVDGSDVAQQPKPHVQCLGKWRFSWYGLHENDNNYRPLPVELTLGPDLARPLHPVWPVIEAHALRLDRLCRQQAGTRFDVVNGCQGPALSVIIPLAERGDAIRILLEEKDVRFYWMRDGEPIAVDLHEERVDRAVYLLLAELAARSV